MFPWECIRGTEVQQSTRLHSKSHRFDGATAPQSFCVPYLHQHTAPQFKHLLWPTSRYLLGDVWDRRSQLSTANCPPDKLLLWRRWRPTPTYPVRTILPPYFERGLPADHSTYIVHTPQGNLVRAQQDGQGENREHSSSCGIFICSGTPEPRFSRARSFSTAIERLRAFPFQQLLVPCFCPTFICPKRPPTTRYDNAHIALSEDLKITHSQIRKEIHRGTVQRAFQDLPRGQVWESI